MARNENNTSTRPTHGVYVVEGEGDKAFWTKVGAAWPHKDNEGFNVQLSALPVNGRLVIRVLTDKKDGEKAPF